MIQKLPHVTKFAEEREKISNECIELASEFFSPYLVCLLKIGVWYFIKNDLDWWFYLLYVQCIWSVSNMQIKLFLCKFLEENFFFWRWFGHIWYIDTVCALSYILHFHWICKRCTTVISFYSKIIWNWK